MSDQKTELRHRLLQQRTALSRDQRALMDHRICAHVLRLFGGSAPLNIAGFSAHRSEPDIFPALQALHEAGHRVHLPVIATTTGDRSMRFLHWTPATRMTCNRYGIAEPVESAACSPALLDHVLCPLVAFTATGRRLGMGAGYYDRCFAFLRDSDGPALTGIAYALQEIDSLPVDHWDVPLHSVITERGFREF